MKHISHILISVVVFTVMGNSVRAADVAEVLVYRIESMPFCGTVDGNDAGITVDILQEVTKHGGPKFRFKELPWLRAQKYVQKNPGTAIIPLTRTPTRKTQYTWVVKLVPNQARLTLAKNPKRKVSVPSPLTVENVKSLRIGIIRGSAFIPTLKELGFTNLEEVNNPEQNAKKLAIGRIVAVVDSSWVDGYLWNQIGENAEDLIIGPNVGEPAYIYLGAGLDFPPELTKQIRYAMSKMEQNGALDAILEKWTNF